MTLYLWLDLLVAAGPVALSFDRRVAYFRVWPSALASVLCVGAPSAAWDALAASAGIWGFNPAFAGRGVAAGLPLAELLFFVVVPFGCLFLYEVVASYLPARAFRFPRPAGFALALLSAAAAAAAHPRAYTEVVFAALALFFLIATALSPALLGESSFWTALGLSYLPFAVVNGVLTALPVVVYDPRAILGVRLSTIPLEDFFYSFSMLGFLFFVHRALRQRLRIGGMR